MDGWRAPDTLLHRARNFVTRTPDRAWYACYTHSRREKKVEVLLRQREVECFLPLAPRERQWHDRKKVVSFPLFPSYVFARFDAGELLSVLKTPGIADVVSFGGRLLAIPDAEIQNIIRFTRALRASGYEPPPPVQLVAGQSVRIMSGPFEGIEGVVIHQPGGKLVLVGLRTIQLGIDVNVPVESVLVLEPPTSPPDKP